MPCVCILGFVMYTLIRFDTNDINHLVLPQELYLLHFHIVIYNIVSCCFSLLQCHSPAIYYCKRGDICFVYSTVPELLCTQVPVQDLNLHEPKFQLVELEVRHREISYFPKHQRLFLSFTLVLTGNKSTENKIVTSQSPSTPPKL